MKTIFEIKREIQNFNEQLKKLHNENIEYAMSGDADSIARTKKDIDCINASLGVLKEELSRREKQNAYKPIDNNNPIMCRSAYYKSIINGDPIPEDIKRNLFGVGLSPTTGAEKFIPTNLAKELLHDPIKENPLRNIMTITSIRGLELPKISYEIEDSNFIKDDATAKEIKLTGDKVSFGRFKFKIMSKISDTILHGTDADLVGYIEQALKEGLAEKEKYCIFKTSTSGEEHMNLYASQNAIKEVEGETMLKAIQNSLADLSDAYYEKATIVMKRSDYYSMTTDLANGNLDFYTKQPEQVFGVPVVFCEYAEKPVVGDFTQLHLNYDIEAVFDSGKDIEKGQQLFVLTAWADIQIKLKSAFRIAKVNAMHSLSARKKQD